jgi:hypothetical protein
MFPILDWQQILFIHQPKILGEKLENNMNLKQAREQHRVEQPERAARISPARL